MPQGRTLPLPEGATEMTDASAAELVNLTIDGRAVSVPKHYNVIKAAAELGIEIPHFCYHPCLSVPGNCRMCQVQIEGQPKLAIACHSRVAEGMKVHTHISSPEVATAQAATLELILINHPLDCTVCDQAGQCKLQDYYYEYDARRSRFVEEKEKKLKVVPLGTHVMLDGERCIMCTRCIRFCDEVTKTSELGLMNRGDRSVIGVDPGRPLENPLSGTVVDLCPVGALTHRDWRFKSRIWFTSESDGICPGCSTGCNVRVATRDGEVVQVKARLNEAVNKEWLCDEGRYGFGRFLPEKRLSRPLFEGQETGWEVALAETLSLKGGPLLVMLSPDLLLEDYFAIKHLLDSAFPTAEVVINLEGRTLSELQAILISPDYAANVRGAEFSGIVPEAVDHEAVYKSALDRLKLGAWSRVLLLGDRALHPSAADESFLKAIGQTESSLAVLTDGASPLLKSFRVVLPGRSILEKAGLLINKDWRLQYTSSLLAAPEGAMSDWQIADLLAEKLGAVQLRADNDRNMTNLYLASEPRMSGLDIRRIKAGGVSLKGKG